MIKGIVGVHWRRMGGDAYLNDGTLQHSRWRYEKHIMWIEELCLDD